LGHFEQFTAWVSTLCRRLWLALGGPQNDELPHAVE
jgi:hypothetical protein